MLQGVVLEQEVPLDKAKLTFDDQTILDHDALMAALRKAAEKNSKLEIADDDVVRVTGKNTSVTIPIEETEGEIYLLVEGFYYESVNFSKEEVAELIQSGAPRLEIMNAKRNARKWAPSDYAMLTAASGDMSDDARLDGVTAQYYIGSRDYLLNLGYGQTTSKLKLTFSAAGEYHFDRIALIAQPMDNYPKKVAALQKRRAEDVHIASNWVTVKYDLKQRALACVAIPYSACWSATVDGEEAEILPVNGMYMGVMLDKGKHTIVLHYTLRGLLEGTIVSLATLVGLVVFAVVRKRAKNRRAVSDQ